ncbi:MAG: hypothetical protein M3P83_03420 [Actinomycetota bacterium]|nr:hypothetical protein [Actinomycetota bacterium]
MAKALLGYVGGTDPRHLEETRNLRLRVRDLEAQILRLQSENDALTAALRDAQLVALTAGEKAREPAFS